MYKGKKLKYWDYKKVLEIHEALEMVNSELSLYHTDLSDKVQVVAGTKTDAMTSDDRQKALAAYCKKKKYKFFSISAATGVGIRDVMNCMGKAVEKNRKN